jgi:hypothetical protein
VHKGERFAQARIAQVQVTEYFTHHPQMSATVALLPGEGPVAPRRA